MAHEEKSQEELAAELLEQMASSRQSVADSVHDGGEVVGLENIHIEGTDIDFSSVRGPADAPAADGAARSADGDFGIGDIEKAEEPGFTDEDGAGFEEHEEGHLPSDDDSDGIYDAEDDAYDAEEDEDVDGDAYDIDDETYDDPYDDDVPVPEPDRGPGRRKREKPVSFTVKSAYGDEARTLMYVTISKSKKIYRMVPGPVEENASEEMEDQIAEAAES